MFNLRVLAGSDLATAVREMFAREDRLRCAVAFWGPEFSRLACERSAMVILDVSMGCTSRMSLEALGVGPEAVDKHAIEHVRVLDGLHAKLYLGGERCILGSANASGNALGRADAPPKLLEAAIEFDRADDPEAFSQVEALWQSYLDSSREVTLADHELAPRIAATNAARDWRGEPAQMISVLQAVLQQPDNFKGTTFTFGDHDIERDDLDEADKGYKKEYEVLPKTHRRSHICTIDAGDPADDAFRSAARIINFWFGKAPGLYAYHDIVRIEHDNSISYYGRRSWSHVGRAVGLAHLKQDAVWAADHKIARKLSKLAGQQKSWRYVALLADAVSEELGRKAPT